MENFEEVLNKAKSGNGQAMEKLILEYMPLINSILSKAGKRIDKEDLRQYLIIKFIENTKKFKKID